MGKKSREKRERRLAEEPNACDVLGGASQYQDPHNLASSSTVKKAEKIATKLVNKTMALRWAKMNLPGQVRKARRMMRLAGTDNFKRLFLKNFPSDLRDKKKQGATEEEIASVYLGCPEFAEFWKDIKMNENDLRKMIREA